MQLGWLAGGNQLGEVVAKRLGYLEEEGIHLVIHPGGPHIDGVGIVASGRYKLGQVSSSGSRRISDRRLLKLPPGKGEGQHCERPRDVPTLALAELASGTTGASVGTSATTSACRVPSAD